MCGTYGAVQAITMLSFSTSIHVAMVPLLLHHRLVLPFGSLLVSYKTMKLQHFQKEALHDGTVAMVP